MGNKELTKTAKEVSKLLQKLPEVKAIAIYGSVAKGVFDEHSDIDIICLSTKVPKITAVKTLLKENKIGIGEIKRTGGLNDHAMYVAHFKNREIQILFFSLYVIENNIKEIKRRGYIFKGESHVVDKSFYNIILWDPNKIFKRFKTRLKKHTDSKPYVKNILWAGVKKFAKGTEVFIALKRGGYIWINSMINSKLNDYLDCLYTINGRFFHAGEPKWAFKQIPAFKYKPKNCVKRLEQISLLGNGPKDLKKKMRIFKTLIKDTEPLIRKGK
ncbi:MAG: nucleotidyltransferase domain-containing protein [Nanoarchaeota archaeon]|nr:nucleotidyltransferase domain-containing protein [Nanoarchaeota archaeon]